nr:MAG TPA: hypothetical protein [Caudoviricetes sp.]
MIPLSSSVLITLSPPHLFKLLLVYHLFVTCQAIFYFIHNIFVLL